MRILLIGGTGTIGSYLVDKWQQEHEVIVAHRNSPTHAVDLTDPKSVKSLLDRCGTIDAVVCTAGEAKWAPFEELSAEDFEAGLKSKLMGQVVLAQLAVPYLQKGGAIVLTTGILADRPVPMTTGAAMVNGAIHSFVKAAALDLDSRVRIKAVACGLVQDAYEKYKNFFPGHKPVSMETMFEAYQQALWGSESGEVIRAYE